jgi:hypothetical protein
MSVEALPSRQVRLVLALHWTPARRRIGIHVRLFTWGTNSGAKEERRRDRSRQMALSRLDNRLRRDIGLPPIDERTYWWLPK